MASFNDRKDSKAGKAALDALVTHELSAGAIVPVMTGLIGAFIPDDAEKVLATVNALVAARRKAKGGITVAVATLTAPRVSETRGLLKLQQWKCWRDLMRELNAIDVSMAMLVKVGTWFRKKAKVDKKTGVCPSRATLLRVINAKQPRKSKPRRKTTLQLVKADTVAAIGDMSATVEALSKIAFPRAAAPFITTLQRALKSLQPFAVAHEKAKEA